MNKRLYPNPQIIQGANNFTDWLKAKMEITNTTIIQLAEAIGVERKTVSSWKNGRTYPALDALILIFAYFGEDRVQIPFYKETIYGE